MKKQKNNLPIIITQPSSSSFISSEDSTNKIFPLLSLDSGKIEPIIPFDNSIIPESDDEEIDYIKSTLKNLLKAENFSIRNKNQIIESLNKRNSKKFLSNILSPFKKNEFEEKIPLVEPMVEDLTELDAVRQIDDLLEFKDNRIKTFTNFLNISPKKEEKKRLSLRSKSNICKNPFIKNDIQSEELSFIIEDNIDEAENNKQILKSVNEENISASLKSVVIKSLMNFGGIKKSSKSQISFKISSPVKINLPLKAGWLKKKTPNPLVKWQKRYCRIENKKFFYYKNDKEMHPLGCLNFDLISVKFEENIKDKKIIQFSFSVSNPQKIFIFKNFDKNNNDLLYWAETIKNNMKNSEGFEKSVHLLKTPKFWKDIRISEKQFFQKADTMDIILFQSKNFLGKLQRSLTRSQYDHVAIILRSGDSELRFLEAEMNGVGICDWKTFMKNHWYNLYKSICFRHLEIDRNDDFTIKVEKFINMVIGNKYTLNPIKLIKQNSDIYDDYSNLENRGFFCSELVACAYKFLNLLPKKKAATKYWPGSFSKEKKLPFIGNRKLGEQYLIDFTLKT